jgi:putative phage-type endonuclease
MEQRSENWFKHRLGRFTASQVSDLMGIKGLGETGKTLAFKKACEIVFGRDPEWDVETWDMKRGTETEPEAFELFASMKAKDFIKVEKAEFFPLGDNSGASPDGLVGKDAVLEIKCPRPDKVFRIIKDGVSALDKSWLDQVQLEMKSTNSERCHFFVYAIWQGRPIYHELIIERDDKHIELILERIQEAVVLRDQYVKELQEQIQFEL